MTAATEGRGEPTLVSARRWMIVGCSGAGKSTLARELAAVLDLPVIHLDGHFWNDGWVETPNDEFDGMVSELSARDAWVMDGNYSRTLHYRLPRAEIVILLDLPMLVCLWGVLKRSTIFRGRTRPDLPNGCPERVPDRQFLWWIISYRWRSRPKVLARIEDAPHVRFIRLRSRQAVRSFLGELSSVRTSA